MKILKYILVFAIPVLLFLNLWRAIALGDNYSFHGLHDTFDYVSTFKGFEATYETWSHIGDYFTVQWYDVVGAIAVPAYISLKCLFGIVWLVGSLAFDVVSNVVWFFGWIFKMIGG